MRHEELKSFFLYLSIAPTHCICRGLLLHLITLTETHTHTHTESGKLHHNERSARPDTPLPEQSTIPGGIHSRKSTKRATADLQTHDFDRAATEIGERKITSKKNLYIMAHLPSVYQN